MYFLCKAVLMTHRQHLRVWVPDDVLTRSIQLLTEDRRHLVDERTALTNQLTAALKTYFPQALNSGPSLAPRLLAAFGSDRGRFEFAAEMQQLSGIAPVTEKSGT